MITDVIDFFGNISTAVSEKFVRKVELRQVPDDAFHTRKVDVNHVFLGYTLFPDQFESRSEQRENERTRSFKVKKLIANITFQDIFPFFQKNCNI